MTLILHRWLLPGLPAVARDFQRPGQAAQPPVARMSSWACRRTNLYP